jgi:Ca2+-binding RTX toxin-like protein
LVITDGSNQTPVEVGGKLVTLVLGRDSANLTDMFGSVSGYGLYFGFGGSDTIEGGANGNYIFGGAGNDVIFGGAGNDFISGGSGSDSIFLDTGSDTVLFDSLTGADTIADFNSSVDLIQLAKTAMVTLGAVGTLSDAEFKSGAGLTSAPEATTRIFYDLTSGALYYDADGSGSVNAIPLATFTDHPLLTRNNFFIA